MALEFEDPQLMNEFKVLSNEITHLGRLSEVSFSNKETLKCTTKNTLSFQLNEECRVSISYEVILVLFEDLSIIYIHIRFQVWV